MKPASATSFLDRPAARVLALLCFVFCLAILAYIHRDDLGARLAGAPTGNDPVARCFAERADDIDQMLKEGGITEDQARVFKERAESLCRTGPGG